MKDFVIGELTEARGALDHLISNEGALAEICAVADAMAGCLASGQKIISCGNGGSMCDAMHFAEELSGRYRNDRPALAAVSISDPSHISCVANDYGYEHVFSRWVEAHGRAGDCVLCISTSGSSANIINAAQTAKSLGMKVVALTGQSGSQLEPLADHCICTPGGSYADRVQELHIKVIHILIGLVERLMVEKK